MYRIIQIESCSLHTPLRNMIPYTTLEPSIAFHEYEPKYCSLKIRVLLFGDSNLRSEIKYRPYPLNLN